MTITLEISEEELARLIELIDLDADTYGPEDEDGALCYKISKQLNDQSNSSTNSQ